MLPYGSNKISNLKRKEIRRRVAEGETIASLARQFAVNRKTIRRHALGVSPPPNKPPRGYASSIDYTRALRMKSEGKTFVQIGDEFGVTPSAVKHKFTRMAKGRS
jgi:DNA-binding CsgD family transcriptional regulator